MTIKATNEFDSFIDTVVDELLAMSDDQVLEGIDPAVMQAEGLRLLQAAKVQVERARPAVAKVGNAGNGPKVLEVGTDIADE
ncbi:MULTISPECIES: hypothetical protein [Rugamonas]|uniref:hypothetical protein n=1 Tax=Rugamonas TaxID=212744 RepID=UPI000B8699F6|nr:MULTISPECIES: hypothetical protein [Rugamonas]WGG51433.1 hypothetical protein QC826_03995 [Rugamonas sp. DEMB1]